MSSDQIGYELLTQEAMRTVVRSALQLAAAPTGLPGRHHFYITFRTNAAGVSLPDHVSLRYPEEMTIVLEHQFWDLEVYPDRFRVILKFAGHPHPIVVPFSAVTRFYDPSVRFGLQFDKLTEAADPAAEPEVTLEEERPAVAAESGAVVSLDKFRKK